MQDRAAIERGMFDETGAGGVDAGADGKNREGEVPESDEEDQEAVRQHAVAALNLVQQAKKVLTDASDDLSKEHRPD